ncbi:MAG: glycosyl hydrolase 108 family protein [Agitococcus sp.]|nr:glycosyl hydrolase 108 family protein [Agitococcus sp.]
MKTSFDTAFEHTIGKEGNYANNPNDLGGETMYGITKALASRYGYVGDMRKLPLETAKYIYRHEFWDKMRLDDVAVLNELVAAEIFDTGVNMGNGIAIGFLQQALNAFNQRGSLYPDIKEDQSIGPSTISALRQFFAKRGAKGGQVLLKTLNSLQAARYIYLSQTRQANEEFVYGWIDNRVGMAAQ